MEKAKKLQKNVYFCFIDYAKAFVWITTNYGKFLRRWEYQTTSLASWETCMQVKKQQLELDMEQWTGSKLGKEYVMAVYSHPIYLTYICRVHHAKRWAGWSTSWNQTARRNISNLRYADDTNPHGRKQRRTKEPPDESERGEWKVGLKLNIQKTKIMKSGHITSWQIDGEAMETVQTLLFWAPKSLQNMMQPWN